MQYYLTIFLLCATLQITAQAEWTIYNTSNSGLPYDNVFCALPDEQGNLWVGTDYGLGYFDGENWTTFRTDNSGLPHNSVRALLLDDNDDLWIGTFIGGLARYDGTDWTVYNIGNSGLEDNFARSLLIDNDGLLWIGTSGGLHSFDGTDWKVYNMNNSDLLSNNIPSLALDAQNALWVGTLNGGVARLKDSTMTVYTADNTQLTDNTILDIYIDDEQNKWFACPAGGLNVFDINNNQFTFITINSPICDNSISAIAELHDTIFLGTAPAGICTYGHWMTYNTDNSPLTTNTIRNLNTQGDSILWISTDNGGLIKFKPDLHTDNQPVSDLPDIQIYPNPTSDFIHIQTPVNTNIRLYDMTGRLWYNAEKISGTKSLPVQHLQQGIYLLELDFERDKIIKKIIIK